MVRDGDSPSTNVDTHAGSHLYAHPADLYLSAAHMDTCASNSDVATCAADSDVGTGTRLRLLGRHLQLL